MKYSFPEDKTDDQILNEIKLGIRQDIFREPEEKVDTKKAKSKGPIKEELKNHSNTKQYNLQATFSQLFLKSQDILFFYEKVFNGYTSLEDVNEIDYEKSRRESAALFPCSLGEQNEYLLETHEIFLIQRFLHFTTKVMNAEVGDSWAFMIENNSIRELKQKFKIIDPDYEEYK